MSYIREIFTRLRFLNSKFPVLQCLCQVEDGNMNHLFNSNDFPRNGLSEFGYETPSPGEFNSGLEKKCLGDYMKL